MRELDLAYHITNYFTHYLSIGKNVSVNTIKSYRDTFKLLFIFFQSEKNIAIQKLSLKHLERENILEFLDWLELQRNNSISTRNQRLAAIHAFFKYLQIEKPDNLLQCQMILSIPIKKCPKHMADFLTPELLQCVFNEPNKNTLQGRRDLTILSILYDTGARVQELCDLTLRDLRLDNPAIVKLKGKGNKIRTVPLMKNSVELIKIYLSDNRLNPVATPDHPLFYNNRNSKMTRGGIAYIVDKYIKSAHDKNPSVPEKLSPHGFRHSKAMHLYQSGIPLIYIRDILGHENLATTQIYAKLDTELKREALENVYPELTEHNLPDWNSDASLMEFLLSL